MPDDGGARDGSSAAPVDFDVLDRLAGRLRGSDRFETVERRPDYAPSSVVVDFDPGYFPAAVNRAYSTVRWYENGDFSIHYVEQWRGDDRWECRWDRHPNAHNDRGHVHPPPDATTPGRNVSFPDDWRDVLADAVEEVDGRIRGFWDG